MCIYMYIHVYIYIYIYIYMYVCHTGLAASRATVCALSNRILHREHDRGSEHLVVRWFGEQLGNCDLFDKFYVIL